MRDDAVSEIVGFILAFAVSSVVLVVVMQAYGKTRSEADHMLADAELQAIADRVATKVVQVGVFSLNNENATLTLSLRVPPAVDNAPYQVHVYKKVAGSTITYLVNATSASMSGAKASSILNIGNARIPIDVTGSVWPSNEKIEITYSRDAKSGRGTIQLKEG